MEHLSASACSVHVGKKVGWALDTSCPLHCSSGPQDKAPCKGRSFLLSLPSLVPQYTISCSTLTRDAPLGSGALTLDQSFLQILQGSGCMDALDSYNLDVTIILHNFFLNVFSCLLYKYLSVDGFPTASGVDAVCRLDNRLPRV